MTVHVATCRNSEKRHINAYAQGEIAAAERMGPADVARLEAELADLGARVAAAEASRNAKLGKVRYGTVRYSAARQKGCWREAGGRGAWQAKLGRVLGGTGQRVSGLRHRGRTGLAAWSTDSYSGGVAQRQAGQGTGQGAGLTHAGRSGLAAWFQQHKTAQIREQRRKRSREDRCSRSACVDMPPYKCCKDTASALAAG